MAKQLPSNETLLSLRQCFQCSGWFQPQYMVTVMFSNLPQEVCVKCKRQFEKLQKEMKLEVQKQKEEDAMENQAPEDLGFGS